MLLFDHVRLPANHARVFEQKVCDVVQIIIIECLVFWVRVLLFGEYHEANSSLIYRPVSKPIVVQRLLRVQLANYELLEELFQTKQLTIATGNCAQTPPHLTFAIKAFYFVVGNPLHV